MKSYVLVDVIHDIKQGNNLVWLERMVQPYVCTNSNRIREQYFMVEQYRIRE